MDAEYQDDRVIRDVSNQYANDAALSKVLRRQLKTLAATEKDVHEKLEKQRLEHLVEKVEAEVEYEGILEEMCVRVRAEDELVEIERREREWELERREVRLEEEVILLKSKVRSLENDLRLAQSNAEGRAEGDVDELIQQMVLQLSEGENLNSEQEQNMLASISSRHEEHPVFVAFEDLLKEADDRHDREKRALEDVIRLKEEMEDNFKRQRRNWHVREKQMDSHILALEKEVGRSSTFMREKDALIASEKERRQVLKEETDKVCSMLREERIAHTGAVAKLKKLESSFHKLKEKLVKKQMEMTDNPMKNILKELENDVGRICATFVGKKHLEKLRALEAEQLDALRSQCDVAAKERDMLEEKLTLLIKRSRDREGEIDAMWLEREKVLTDKMAAIEKEAEEWESKCSRYEAEFLHEKNRLEQEILSVRKVWADEKRMLESKVRERDIWMKQHCEVQSLRTTQLKLVDTLTSDQQVKEKVSIDQDLGLSATAGQISTQETRSESESCIDVECMGGTDGDETCVSRFKVENLEKENGELKKETERLRIERKDLERKVLETLELIEGLKKEMEVKETQVDWERKQMEAVIVSKTSEVDSVRKLLDAKELEMEVKAERFRNEIQQIEEEIERERKERQKLMELQFSSKRKMVSEAKLKEEVWEKDIDRLVHELTVLRVELRDRNEECEMLKREALVREFQFDDEKRAASSKLDEDMMKNEVSNGFGGSDCQGGSEDRRNLEWQLALRKVAVFDKQISEAMLAIQSLREELSAKEVELSKARAEPDVEWERREEAWAQEQALHMQKEQEWQEKEKYLCNEKARLLKLLDSERSEAADSTAMLQGLIRELHWLLTVKDEKPESWRSKQVEDALNCSKKSDMVKVHASHLKDVDEYMNELKSKVQELEKRLKKIGKTSVNVCCEESTHPIKKTKEGALDEALLHIEKEMFRISPDKRSRLMEVDVSRIRCVDRGILKTDHQNGRAWDLDAPGRMNEDAHDLLTLALPPRNQKKWVVDSAWVEHVRKEYSSLTQQLVLERHRVATLGQVEAENRWMEAMMLRALEQKKDMEIKISELQHKEQSERE